MEQRVESEGDGLFGSDSSYKVCELLNKLKMPDILLRNVKMASNFLIVFFHYVINKKILTVYFSYKIKFSV